MKNMNIEKHTIKNVKEYLKDIAKRITILKVLRKDIPHQNLKGFDTALVDEVKKLTIPSELDRYPRYYNSPEYLVRVNSREFRHYHIAYCEFRGRTREQIENKVSEHTTLWRTDEKYIKEIKEKITHDMEEYNNERKEDVRLSA
jgi:hypothetical protein